jgi:transposase
MARPSGGTGYISGRGNSQRRNGLMTIQTLGIDLGKTLCSLAGLDAAGRVVLRKRIRRDKILAFATNLPRCTIAMEACCGAHHLAHRLIALGHTVRLMPPEYVRPYVKAMKNDDRDAEAIAEAATRPTMRFVEPKSEAQLDLQTLHRRRARLVGQRTALINQLRAILLERGITVAQGPARLAASLAGILADNALSPRIRRLIEQLREEWRGLDAAIAELDAEFKTIASQEEPSRQLMTIPGFGPLAATALRAAIGRGEAMNNGRDFAAYLGLVPRQDSTGGRTRLLGISKRGDRYLRTLLIHGARAALPHLAAKDTPLSRWLRGLRARCHHNVAVVALANKLARIAWAVLASGRSFEAEKAAAA